MAVRIAQLTDLHLCAVPGRRVHGADVWANLRAALRHLEANGSADLLVLTGDLANERAPATYQLLRRELAAWAGRVCVLPGNHDHLGRMWSVFADLRGELGGFRREADGWTLLGLDSKWPWRVRGRYRPELLEWLRSELQRAAGPSLLFVHHPPIPVSCWWLDKDLPRLRHRLADVVRGSGLHGIACGHVHQPLEGRCGGVPVWTTPAVAWQFRPRSRWPAHSAPGWGYRRFVLDGERLTTQVVEQGP